ncbi:MAG: HAD family hydrolase [Candidatus Bipolaricaulota bacterium]
MTKLLGFDMDGVILDSDDLSQGNWFVELFNRTLREFGIPETEENARLLYIKNLRNNAGAICRKFGIDNAEKLWNRRDANYVAGKLAALEAGKIPLYRDVAALEELATDPNYRIGIVSNSPQIVVDRVVAYFSLDRIFDTWIGRGTTLSDIQFAKPAPDLLERLKAILGVVHGYYIGDQPEDAPAARAASLVPIIITRNGNGGDIKSLTELKHLL